MDKALVYVVLCEHLLCSLVVVLWQELSLLLALRPIKTQQKSEIGVCLIRNVTPLHV